MGIVERLMAEYKNQHYVPKCYLRKFSSDEEDKKINIFLSNRFKVISNSALASQCSKDYFYSKNSEVEKALSQLESVFTETLNRLIAGDGVSSFEDMEILRVSTILQHIRTKGAVERSLKAVGYLKEIAPENEWEDIQENAALDSIKDLRYFTNSISDLHCMVIRNRSKVPFVTSDDPVIAMNKFYHMRVQKKSGTGLHNSGLILLFPLSPEFMFMLYDKDIYSIDSDSRKVLDVLKDKEIREFNQLQYLNSLSCVYFPSGMTLIELESNFKAAQKNRCVDRIKITYGRESQSEKNSGGRSYKMENVNDELPKESGLVHSETISISPVNWPKIFRIRHKPKFVDTQSAAGFLRMATLKLRK